MCLLLMHSIGARVSCTFIIESFRMCRKRGVSILKILKLVYTTPSAGTYVSGDFEDLDMLRQVVVERLKGDCNSTLIWN